MCSWLAGIVALWFGVALLLLVAWSRFWQHQKQLIADEQAYDRVHPWHPSLH